MDMSGKAQEAHYASPVISQSNRQCFTASTPLLCQRYDVDSEEYQSVEEHLSTTYDNIHSQSVAYSQDPLIPHITATESLLNAHQTAPDHHLPSPDHHLLHANWRPTFTCKSPLLLQSENCQENLSTDSSSLVFPVTPARDDQDDCTDYPASTRTASTYAKTIKCDESCVSGVDCLPETTYGSTHASVTDQESELSENTVEEFSSNTNNTQHVDVTTNTQHTNVTMDTQYTNNVTMDTQYTSNVTMDTQYTNNVTMDTQYTNVTMNTQYTNVTMNTYCTTNVTMDTEYTNRTMDTQYNNKTSDTQNDNLSSSMQNLAASQQSYASTVYDGTASIPNLSNLRSENTGSHMTSGYTSYHTVVEQTSTNETIECHPPDSLLVRETNESAYTREDLSSAAESTVYGGSSHFPSHLADGSRSTQSTIYDDDVTKRNCDVIRNWAEKAPADTEHAETDSVALTHKLMPVRAVYTCKSPFLLQDFNRESSDQRDVHQTQQRVEPQICWSANRMRFSTRDMLLVSRDNIQILEKADGGQYTDRVVGESVQPDTRIQVELNGLEAVDSPDPVADRVSLTIGEKLLKDASPHIAEYLNNENGQGYGEDTRATQEVNEMTPPISPVAPVEGHMTMETALEEIREMELQMLQTSRVASLVEQPAIDSSLSDSSSPLVQIQTRHNRKYKGRLISSSDETQRIERVRRKRRKKALLKSKSWRKKGQRRCIGRINTSSSSESGEFSSHAARIPKSNLDPKKRQICRRVIIEESLPESSAECGAGEEGEARSTPPSKISNFMLGSATPTPSRSIRQMLELENSNENNAAINAAVNGENDVEENSSKNNVEASNLADNASVDENQVKRIDGQVEATLPCKAVGTAKVDVITEDAQVSSDEVDNQNEIRERKEAEEQAISNSSERICLGLDISSLEDDQQLKQVSSPQKLQALNNSVKFGGSCNINQSQNLSKEETTKLESESKCVVNPLNTQNEGSENQSPADQSELVIVRRSRRQASANALSKIVKMNQLENKPSLVAKFSQNLHTTDSQKSKSLNEVQPGPNVEQPSVFMSKQKSKLNASFGGCSNERTSRSHSTPCPSRSNFLKSNRTEQCSISPAVTPILKRGKTCNMLSALESSLSLSAQQNTGQKKNDAPISVSKDSALNAPINESIISIEHHINCNTNQLNNNSLVANKELLKKSQTAPKASATTKTLSELPWEKQRVFKRRSSSADSRAQRSTSLEANKKVDTNEEQRIATQRNSSAKLEMLVKENEATNQLQQAEKHVYLKQHSKRKCAKTIKHSKTDQQAENVQENNIKVIQQNSPIGSKKVVEQCEENAYKEGVAQNIENGKHACIKQSKVGSKKYVAHQKKPVVQNKTHQSTEFHEHGPATISKKRRDATFTVEKSLVESTKVKKWQENTIFVQIPSNQVGKLADSVYCTNGSGPSSSSSDNNSRNINQLENSLTNSAKKLADKPGLKRDNSLHKPVMGQSIVNTRNNSFRCALQEPSETSSKVATTSIASTPAKTNAISVQADDFNSSLDTVYSEDSPSVKPDCLPTENNSAEIVCVPEHSTIKVMDKLENSMDPNISHSQHIESSQNVCDVKNAPIDSSVKRLPSALSFEGEAVASEKDKNEKTISSKLKNTSTIASDNEFPTKHKGSRKMIKCLPIRGDNSFFETSENSEHTIGKDVEQNSSNLANLDNTVNSKSKLSDQVKQTELAMSVSHQNACNAELSNILLKSKALPAVAESSASSAHLESPSVSFISQKRLPSSRGSSFSVSFLDAFQRSASSLEETGSQDKLKTKQKEQLREEQQIETAVIVSSSNIKCHNSKSPTKPPNLTEDLSQVEKANSILEANSEHEPEAWTDKKPISRSPCVTGKNINYGNSNAASSDESLSVVSETPPEPNMCEVQAPTAVKYPPLIGSISNDKVDSFTGSSDKKLVTSPSSPTYETRSQLTGHNTKQIDDSPPIRVTRSRTKSLPIFSNLPTNQSAPDSKRKRTKSAPFAVESKKNIVDSVKMAPSKARVSFASSVMHNDLNTMTPCSRGNAILAMFDTPDVTIGKKSTKIKSILKSSASMTPGSNGPFNHSDDVTPVSLDVPSSDSVEIETAPSSEPKTSTMTVKQDIQVKAINNSTSLTQPTGMLTNIKLFQQSKPTKKTAKSKCEDGYFSNGKIVDDFDKKLREFLLEDSSPKKRPAPKPLPIVGRLNTQFFSKSIDERLSRFRTSSKCRVKPKKSFTSKTPQYSLSLHKVNKTTPNKNMKKSVMRQSMPAQVHSIKLEQRDPYSFSDSSMIEDTQTLHSRCFNRCDRTQIQQTLCSPNITSSSLDSLPDSPVMSKSTNKECPQHSSKKLGRVSPPLARRRVAGKGGESCPDNDGFSTIKVEHKMRTPSLPAQPIRKEKLAARSALKTKSSHTKRRLSEPKESSGKKAKTTPLSPTAPGIHSRGPDSSVRKLYNVDSGYRLGSDDDLSQTSLSQSQPLTLPSNRQLKTRRKLATPGKIRDMLSSLNHVQLEL